MPEPHLTKGLKVFNTEQGVKLGICVLSTNRATREENTYSRRFRKHRNLLRRGVYIDINLI